MVCAGESERMENLGCDGKHSLLGPCDCIAHTAESLGVQVDATLEKCPRVISLAKVFWAAPWSFLGASVGIVGLLTGGEFRRQGKIMEFWGGVIPLFLRYFPFVAGSPVATFGHVVVGRSTRHLDACRPHQMIHVRQYECWGPLFVPAYLTCWFVLLSRGRHPYYDNPFEREAYEATSWAGAVRFARTLRL